MGQQLDGSARCCASVKCDYTTGGHRRWSFQVYPGGCKVRCSFLKHFGPAVYPVHAFRVCDRCGYQEETKTHVAIFICNSTYEPIVAQVS